MNTLYLVEVNNSRMRLPTRKSWNIVDLRNTTNMVVSIDYGNIVYFGYG